MVYPPECPNTPALCAPRAVLFSMDPEPRRLNKSTPIESCARYVLEGRNLTVWPCVYPGQSCIQWDLIRGLCAHHPCCTQIGNVDPANGSMKQSPASCTPSFAARTGCAVECYHSQCNHRSQRCTCLCENGECDGNLTSSGVCRSCDEGWAGVLCDIRMCRALSGGFALCASPVGQ